MGGPPPLPALAQRPRQQHRPDGAIDVKRRAGPIAPHQAGQHHDEFKSQHGPSHEPKAPAQGLELAPDDVTRIQRRGKQEFIGAITTGFCQAARGGVMDDPPERQIEQRRGEEEVRHAGPAARPGRPAAEPGGDHAAHDQPGQDSRLPVPSGQPNEWICLQPSGRQSPSAARIAVHPSLPARAPANGPGVLLAFPPQRFQCSRSHAQTQA